LVQYDDRYRETRIVTPGPRHAFVALVQGGPFLLIEAAECNANAALIAAAPELLQFLEALMDSSPAEATDLLTNHGAELIDKATLNEA
jgi:hypothetical protein